MKKTEQKTPPPSFSPFVASFASVLCGKPKIDLEKTAQTMKKGVRHYRAGAKQYAKFVTLKNKLYTLIDDAIRNRLAELEIAEHGQETTITSEVAESYNEDLEKQLAIRIRKTRENFTHEITSDQEHYRRIEPLVKKRIELKAKVRKYMETHWFSSDGTVVFSPLKHPKPQTYFNETRKKINDLSCQIKKINVDSDKPSLKDIEAEIQQELNKNDKMERISDMKDICFWGKNGERAKTNLTTIKTEDNVLKVASSFLNQ